MKQQLIIVCICCLVAGCGGSKGAATATGAPASDGSNSASAAAPAGADDFGTHAGDASGGGVNGSKLKPSATEAVLKLIVQSETEGPMKGVVVKAVSDDGTKIYTPETDAMGFTEILVPAGAQLTLTYLSLFEDEVKKQASIPNEPHVTMKLTLTWIPLKPKPIDTPDPGILIENKTPDEPVLILKGVEFDTAKATLRPESYDFIAPVIEYLTYKPSAIIELAGHTDNVGKPAKNQKLSEDRANAVRDYIISKGIEGNRIIAVGYGQERPIASNDTEEGRQINRRTEAKEIGK